MTPGRLRATLERSRDRGFLGPGPIGTHLRQAAAMAAATDPPVRFLDLGAGGGVPGLALLVHWEEADATLLDSRRRSAAFLREALVTLDATARASVAEGRAEVLARDPGLRGAFDLVVARSFGPPAVTAECAAGFLEPGGLLLVAEPPDPEPGRWAASGLAQLGLEDVGATRREGFGVARFRAAGAVGDRWPRRAPAKRPLWPSPSSGR